MFDVSADFILTLFRMGYFGAAHGWRGEGGAKRLPFLKSVTDIYYNDKTWHSYTLHKEDGKKYESCDTLLAFC